MWGGNPPDIILEYGGEIPPTKIKFFLKSYFCRIQVGGSAPHPPRRLCLGNVELHPKIDFYQNLGPCVYSSGL